MEQIRSRHVALDKAAWSDFDGVFFDSAQGEGPGVRPGLAGRRFHAVLRGRQELTADEVDQADVNLLYVALTRAKASVRLCESFDEWLSYRRLRPR